MRILFAAPNRDLLGSFKAILDRDLGETVTAFDGVQVLTLLGEREFDLAVLDRNIPRVDYRELLARVREKGLPTVLLTDLPMTAQLLTEKHSAQAYLPYPFLPETLAALLRDLLEKRSSRETVPLGEEPAEVAAFRAGNTELTAGELDVLRKLRDGEPVDPVKEGPCVGALNIRLKRRRSRFHIAYLAEKGYKMVEEHE